jgi:predicted DNA-binding transcriptional regulator AlpA
MIQFGANPLPGFGLAIAMPRHDALPPGLPPRGLSREAAAQYIGVSVGKFDQMTKDGRMPKPIRIDGRKVWDRLALDRAFDALGGPAASPISRTGWEDYLDAELKLPYLWFAQGRDHRHPYYRRDGLRIALTSPEGRRLIEAQGKGVAGTYAFEVAEKKQYGVLLMAKIEEHPLRVEVDRV